MTNRTKRLGFAILAVTAVAAAAFLMRPAPKLAYIGTPGKLLPLLAIDQVRRPWIDLPMPGGKRWTYPNRYQGFFTVYGEMAPISASTAYVLQPELHAGAIDGTGLRFTLPPFDPAYSIWTIGGEEIPLEGSIFDPPVVRCPLVFGDSPRQADLVTTMFSQDPVAFKLQLPASGKPAPVLPKITKTLGNWTVTISPRHWLSPALPLRYDVHVDGAPGATFLVKLSPASRTTLGRYQIYATPYTPEEDGRLFVGRGAYGFGDFETSKEFVLRIAKLRAKEEEMEVQQRGSGTVWIQRDGHSGVIDGQYAFFDDAKAAILRLDGQWILNSDSYCPLLSPSTVEHLRAIPHATKVKGITYVMDEERSVQIKLSVPSTTQK